MTAIKISYKPLHFVLSGTQRSTNLSLESPKKIHQQLVEFLPFGLETKKKDLLITLDNCGALLQTRTSASREADVQLAFD